MPFTFTVEPEFVRMMERMGNIEEIIPKMLDEAVVILSRNVGIQLSAHIGTQDLIKSMRQGNPKRGKNGGWTVFVYPTGQSYTYINEKGKEIRRKKPVSNGEKLAYLEYGTENSSPKLVVTNALKSAEEPVLNAMQKVFEEEVLNGR